MPKPLHAQAGGVTRTVEPANSKGPAFACLMLWMATMALRAASGAPALDHAARQCGDFLARMHLKPQGVHYVGCRYLPDRARQAIAAMRSLARVISRGLPPVRPRALAAARPASVRSLIRSCSNSARVAKMPNTRRPVELVVSISSGQYLEANSFLPEVHRPARQHGQASGRSGRASRPPGRHRRVAGREPWSTRACR